VHRCRNNTRVMKWYVYIKYFCWFALPYCSSVIRNAQDTPIHILVTRKFSRVLDRETIRLSTYKMVIDYYPENKIRSPRLDTSRGIFAYGNGSFPESLESSRRLRGYWHQSNICIMQARQEMTKTRDQGLGGGRSRPVLSAVRSGNETESPVPTN